MADKSVENSVVNADHDANGKFAQGNRYRIKPGEVKNPKGRPKEKIFKKKFF